MLAEELCDIKKRKFILLARYNESFVKKSIIPKMETDIKKVREKIRNKEELLLFEESISEFNANCNKKNCIFAYNLYSYADIPLGKEYDVIGCMNEHFEIVKNSVFECKTKIVSIITADYKNVPMNYINHGHNAICIIYFPDGIPNIINSLYEVTEFKGVKYENIVFLSTNETLNANIK